VAESLERFGAERRKAIDEARRGFLHAPPARSAARRRWSFALAAAVSVAITLVVAFALRDERLTFTANGKNGGVDTWLSANTRAVDVKFSDGTELRLESTSRARVVDVTRDGARIALENGTLRANVVHTGHGAWFLSAGPITVRVTGTRFEMQWTPVREEFTISVSEGSVRVSGSSVATEQPVNAGERLFVFLAEGRYELTNGRASARPTEMPTPPTREQPSEPDEAPRPPASVDVDHGNSIASEWKDLLKRGELRAAFASAEHAGFGKVCDTASAAELLALGDAARVSSRTDRVSEALLSLRRRFPRDPRSAAAAFTLGKVAFDQKRSFPEAEKWFATCIREQPNGSLAREAAGRRMEALRALGDRTATGLAAREYLERYPGGPHAELARSLLP
ncbi:MAG TPA: FecR domain-containing protein, partial [Polyangiaceae bacterium]